MNAKQLAQQFITVMKQNRVSSARDFSENALGVDYVLFQYLDQHENVTPSDLSQALHVTTARMTVILRRLEKANMITRSAHPTDLRKFIIALTPTGRKKLKDQETKQLTYLTDLMAYLGEEDAEAYIRIVSKLAKRRNQSKTERGN
ncbi:MarR family winged helix-turn-helix transcriptional regulator [Lacticaseibacillus brantae]|uniref:HTH marR-type domain-containing protein n=1 Tax=Lacticaseibacillus brantae DSM 23927 TaxID=1423727 RepID=A0A0R2AYE6_9LACO|nr:MarR family transcriptional regulator [Lacticaseibacillus brantae]KRM72087.1 hypothetical protein FC34_GL001071 [Lacticaseibacillus brantae DSM 23927]